MASTQEATGQAPTEVNVTDLRSELLGMLGKVGSAAPAKPAVPPAVVRAAAPAEAPVKGSKKAAVARVEDGPVDPNVTCVKCGNKDSWGTASWCPKCGYYPGIGHEGEIPQEESDGIEDLTFFDLCPPWVLQIAGGLIVITAATYFMGRSLGGNVGWLSLASLIQLSVGAMLLLFAHKNAIMMSLRDPQCPGVMALITYPPAVWMPVLKHLKDRAHLLVTASWGVVACVMALSLYGPIHMGEIKKEIAESKKSKKSFMGKILGTMAQVTAVTQGGGTAPSVNMGDPGSLEDAIGGFAGIATEQGGLGDIVNGGGGMQDANVDALMQQAVDSAVSDATGGTGGGGGSMSLDPNAMSLPTGGAGGSNSLDGAIGEFADAAVGQVGIDDPDQLAKMMTSDLAGGTNGKQAVEQRGGSGTSIPEGEVPQNVQTIPVAPNAAGGTGSVRTLPATRNIPSTVGGKGASGQTASSKTTFAPDKVKQAVVFGYLNSAGGEIRTLLIATVGADGRPRFAGKLSRDAMTKAEWDGIVGALPGIRTQRPLVACPNAGYWVAPKFVLNVGTERWMPTGPVDAQVMSIEQR